MRALLDTHALLWALTAPDRLSDRARTTLEDLDAEVLVSAASAWEVATKVRIGKLPAAQRLVDDWPTVIDRLGAVELAVSARHALVGGSLRWSHRDPFDRMLAAQSMLEDVVLVTVDPVFQELQGLRIHW